MNPNYQRQPYGNSNYQPQQSYAEPGYGPQQGYGPGVLAALEAEAPYQGDLSEPAVMAFTKRVYGYFTAALFTATASCLGGMELANYMIEHEQAGALRGLGIGAFVMFFASYLAVIFMRRNHSPLKTGLLFVFAACAGFMTTPLVAAFANAGLISTVVFAFGITTVSFFGLTVYTLVSGKDFRHIGGILLMGLIALIGIGLMSWFIPMGSAMTMIYSLLGIAVFLGFILFDTSRVTRDYFRSGDAVSAALMLFYDFFMLFRYVLYFLAGSRR